MCRFSKWNVFKSAIIPAWPGPAAFREDGFGGFGWIYEVIHWQSERNGS